MVISVVTSAMLDQQQLRNGTVLVNRSARRRSPDPAAPPTAGLPISPTRRARRGDLSVAPMCGVGRPAHSAASAAHSAGDEVKAQQVANQIALAQAVAEHRLKKIFTFHRNVASARSFTSEGSEWIGTHLPDFAALHINGAMSTAARDGLMTEFKAARRAVMSNARCLTEGIALGAGHPTPPFVPTVDMVAFLTPKRSKVDIVQAVGRAMRNAPGKTAGYILVPLYVDLTHGEREASASWSASPQSQPTQESLDAAVARAEFDEVWAVLQAMQEQDEVGERGASVPWWNQDTQPIQTNQHHNQEPNGSRSPPTLTLDKLRRAIATRCLDRLARPWDEMLQLFVAYQKQHRHPRVPKSAPAPWTELGEWVDHVRDVRCRSLLQNVEPVQIVSNI